VIILLDRPCGIRELRIISDDLAAQRSLLLPRPRTLTLAAMLQPQPDRIMPLSYDYDTARPTGEVEVLRGREIPIWRAE
jgi:hypothetical protein